DMVPPFGWVAGEVSLIKLFARRFESFTPGEGCRCPFRASGSWSRCLANEHTCEGRNAARWRGGLLLRGGRHPVCTAVPPPGRVGRHFGGLGMQAYYIVVGVLLVVGGLALTVCPRQVWLGARGWQFADPGQVRLSGAYLAWLRVSGAVGALLGLLLLAYAFR